MRDANISREAARWQIEHGVWQSDLCEPGGAGLRVAVVILLGCVLVLGGVLGWMLRVAVEG